MNKLELALAEILDRKQDNVDESFVDQKNQEPNFWNFLNITSLRLEDIEEIKKSCTMDDKIYWLLSNQKIKKLEKYWIAGKVDYDSNQYKEVRIIDEYDKLELILKIKKEGYGIF